MSFYSAVVFDLYFDLLLKSCSTYCGAHHTASQKNRIGSPVNANVGWWQPASGAGLFSGRRKRNILLLRLFIPTNAGGEQKSELAPVKGSR